ncbi:hypothetical protein C7377_0862 [Balneicella halophila]|uniref:Superfamily III holin-X n=1 Tax=Balneicella halophila TaxID=1537566 RepID=A0A7L4URY5_BALHA|nr:hypothetical protein [Balneicella halophila]PVX52538.1 hypothetical protein C7377_0862 [Balneicella halophila]
MALENITHNAKELKAQMENVMSDNMDYYKLLGFKIAAKTATGLTKILIVALACLLIVFFLCLAGGFALGEYWGNNAYGFLTMAGIILVALILFLALKKFIVDRPILRILSEIVKED